MRPTSLLLPVLALVFLPIAGAAQTEDQCKETCASEKDARDQDCPSPSDYEELAERARCLEKSETIYVKCIDTCSATATAPVPQQTPSSTPGSY